MCWRRSSYRGSPTALAPEPCSRHRAECMAGASCDPARSRRSIREDDGCFRLTAVGRGCRAERQLLPKADVRHSAKTGRKSTLATDRGEGTPTTACSASQRELSTHLGLSAHREAVCRHYLTSSQKRRSRLSNRKIAATGRSSSSMCEINRSTASQCREIVTETTNRRSVGSHA